jgi:hypothetical protein
VLVADFPDQFEALGARDLGAGKKVRGMAAYGVPKGTELRSVTCATDPDIAIGLVGVTLSAPPVKRPPRVAETVDGGGLAFTVSSMTYPASLTHGMWTTSAMPGSKLVLLKAMVRNLDRAPSYKVDPLSIGLVDANGKRRGHFDRSAPGLADAAPLPPKNLRPGATVSGKVVVSVSKHAKLKPVRYESGVLGPPLEVRVMR